MNTPPTKKIVRDLSCIGEIVQYQIYNINPNTTSSAQRELLNRALHGLKNYTDQELYMMNSAKKARILKVHNKTKEVINEYKQQKVIDFTNALFENLFPGSSISKFMIENSFTDPKFNCKISMKDLNIDKDSLIELLVSKKILPSNYHNL